MKRYSYIILTALTILSVSCNRPIRYDLIVENATIFDVNTGEVIPGKTILVNGDSIVGIIDANEPVRTKKVVDADGRLVTPGNIDTHVSFEKAIYSTHKNADNHPKVLTTFYRSRFSRNYLPYGITTALDMGTEQQWLDQIYQWKQNPKFTDLLVSLNMEPFYDLDLNEFDSKIQNALNDLFSKNVKYIYVDKCLSPEKSKLLKQRANQKNITIFEKIDSSPCSLKESPNIEHIYSPILYVFDKYGDRKAVDKQIENIYGKATKLPEEIYTLEVFKFIVENSPELLDTIIASIDPKTVSISSNLHSLAEYCDLNHFKSEINSDKIKLSNELKHRVAYNFNHMLSFVKRMHDSNISLRIGTNSQNAGKAFVAEQMILADAGINAADIIKISTINAAKALGIDNQVGSIEVGKKANLVIYDESPLDNPINFASTRRVVKSGRLFKRYAAKLDIEE
ncbi:MAG: amidohydrolase family protein [Bacteroidales bacterium]